IAAIGVFDPKFALVAQMKTHSNEQNEPTPLRPRPLIRTGRFSRNACDTPGLPVPFAVLGKNSRLEESCDVLSLLVLESFRRWASGRRRSGATSCQAASRFSGSPPLTRGP